MLIPYFVSAEAKTINLKFAHQTSPAGFVHKSFHEPWARMVEKATEGRVKITIYPGQSLCKGKEAIEATIGGVTDINWWVQPYFPGRFPLTSVMSLPFVNAPTAEVNSRILQEIYEEFPEVQAEYSKVKVLMLGTGAPYFLISTKKPVGSLKDMNGLKIRGPGWLYRVAVEGSQGITGLHTHAWRLRGRGKRRN